MRAAMRFLLAAAVTLMPMPLSAQTSSIGNLPAASAVTAADLVPCTQGFTSPGTGVTRKCTAAQIQAHVQNMLSTMLDARLSGVHGAVPYRGVTEWTAAAAGASGQVWTTAGAGANPLWTTPAGGTVVSVTLTGDGTVLSATPTAPVTGTGTLSATLASQLANRVLAGPASGGAVAPTFRSMMGADLPNPSAATLGGVQSFAAVTNQWIRQISTSGVPTSSQPAFTDISGAVAAAQLPNPSASTLGGVRSAAAVASQFITSISTSGVPALAQPAFTGISGLVITSPSTDQLIRYDGTNWVNGTVASGLINTQTFDASGTWTKPTGYAAGSLVLIRAWGAGGSGERAAVSGAGGGGGGYVERRTVLSALGATETVTLGAGGVARTGSDQAGATGGNTTFGALLTSYGGGGGSGGGSGGGGPFSAGGISTPNNISGGAIFHGGDSAETAAGQPSLHGGGGGGGGDGGARSGGISINGGAGGAGGGAAGGNGVQPGGGGGGSVGGTSGAGALGRVQVIVYPG